MGFVVANAVRKDRIGKVGGELVGLVAGLMAGPDCELYCKTDHGRTRGEHMKYRTWKWTVPYEKPLRVA